MIFENQTLAVGIWIVAALFLGLGGLLRERATGSSAFTLALPVGRARLIGVRVGMGVLELIALAAWPWLANFLISWVRETPFSVPQAACCIAVLVACGLNYLALASLVSSMIEGEYTAALTALGTVIVVLVTVVASEWDRGLDFLMTILGGECFERETYLFPGVASLQWTTMFYSVVMAAAMILAAIVITRQKDF